ncbi:NAD-dependent epimerase/dehydratase family protein [Novosphingobium pituita]|uniref:NAD(P)-dependent oxidoreductase n=1 Tax=Novosphingobium pituita TaxID=3056842 RepID=A0ABQ6P9I7_9SPHN|nr:NAD(P)-dependent oxidoreductase [Novosphingobium sp. IK01]GMM61926.1 NAD(P)-dependent oxidoreductase [Novosphingobium sp. IK01]
MEPTRLLVTGGSGFIGTNLIDALSMVPGLEIMNVDMIRPKVRAHDVYWHDVDIRDCAKLTEAITKFGPNGVIHLAARTDLGGKELADYSSNTDGVASLLKALDAIRFSGPAIFASSMYVCRPGYTPTSDTDYQPHTPYGESKVVGEQILRDHNPAYPWLIIRPTSIWGPWFGTPYADFFHVVLSRRYANIANVNMMKTYGYVGNTVVQIHALLDRVEACRSRVVYLGDWPAYSVKEWAAEIAAFVPYKVPTVPKAAFRLLAVIGDAAKVVGVKFPMTSFRLKNLTTDNVHDTALLRSIVGDDLRFSRRQGNEITVAWLRAQRALA